MVFPHALDGFQETVALCRALDGFGAAAELACTACAAAAGEGGHDPVVGEPVEVLDDECLDAAVQLVAVYGGSAGERRTANDARLKRTRLYA